MWLCVSSSDLSWLWCCASTGQVWASAEHHPGGAHPHRPQRKGSQPSGPEPGHAARESTDSTGGRQSPVTGKLPQTRTLQTGTYAHLHTQINLLVIPICYPLLSGASVKVTPYLPQGWLQLTLLLHFWCSAVHLLRFTSLTGIYQTFVTCYSNRHLVDQPPHKLAALFLSEWHFTEFDC